MIFMFKILEIKPCGLGPIIRDVKAFWYKTEIKIINFVLLCLIGFDFMVYPDPGNFCRMYGRDCVCCDIEHLSNIGEIR